MRNHRRKPDPAEESARTRARSKPTRKRPPSPERQKQSDSAPNPKAPLQTGGAMGNVLRSLDQENDRISTNAVESGIIQGKLTIGAANDKYEQEADRIAQQVVQQLHAPSPPASPPPGQPTDRAPSPELQRRIIQAANRPRLASGGTASTEFAAGLNQAKSGGNPIADSIRQPMEQAFGADFSSVKVHTDNHADQLSRSIQAKAFTTGQDIFFSQGTYSPSSSSGQELLAHELTHVVQQQGKKVQRQLAAQPDDALAQQVSDTPEAVIQRMVALAKAKATKADAIELTSINYAVQRAGGPVGLLKDSDFSTLTEEDTIFIVGHGDPGESGDYTADAIVNFLFKGSKALTGKVAAIRFTSCYAGAGVTDDLTDSVVAKIKAALDDKNWEGVEVSGARGPSIKSDEVGDEFAVVDPDQVGDAGKVQNLLMKIHKPKQKTEDAILEQQKKESRPLTLEEKAKIASDETSLFYQQFIASLKDPTGVAKDLKQQLAQSAIDASKVKYVKRLIKILETGPSLLLEPPMLELVSEKSDLTEESQKKGCCFITTACVEAQGLPDDCHELQTLRAFRDSYIRSLDNGNAMIARYYEIAPEIVARIQAQPNAADILAGLYQRVVESVKLVEANQYPDALQNYITVVQELEAEYL